MIGQRHPNQSKRHQPHPSGFVWTPTQGCAVEGVSGLLHGSNKDIFNILRIHKLMWSNFMKMTQNKKHYIFGST